MWKVFQCDTGKILKGFEDEESASEYLERKTGQLEIEIDMDEMSEEEEEEYLEMVEEGMDVTSEIHTPSDFSSIDYDENYHSGEDSDFNADDEMLSSVYDEDGEVEDS